jgi:hypothetical protein
VIVGFKPWLRQPKPDPPSRSSRDSSSSSGRGQERITNYIGGSACLECHPGESALQARSGHDRTLRRAERSAIIAWLDGKTVSDPEHPEVKWSYHVRDKQLIVERTIGDRTESLPLDYALGSGKHGVTFLANQGRPKTELDPSGLEHRLSYLADGPRLAMTPGQARNGEQDPHHVGLETDPFGRPLDVAGFHECFSCHTTLTSTVARNRLETTTMIPNVSCERCHGPGRAHVAAARQGRTELNMRMGHDRVQPSVEVGLCGECHRLPTSIPSSAIQADNLAIVRFQGVGVSMSACYANGLSGLRCTTCHDPHDRASSDRRHYEAACLSCHGSAPTQKACLVSPAANCTGCHMPRREVLGNGIFTDHWIRKPSPTPRGGADPPKTEATQTSSTY